MPTMTICFKGRGGHSTGLMLLLGLVLAGLSTPAQGDSTATRPAGVTEHKLANKEAILKAIADQHGKAQVIVHLKPPPKAPAVVDYNDVRSETSYRIANREHEDTVIARFSRGDSSLIERFQNQPTLLVGITEAGLRDLQNDPDVELVAPVVEMQLCTTQGLALINSTRYRNMGSTFRGAGVSIAICDTGIDCWHPQLGAVGYPNWKVLGGWDYGSFDDVPEPDGGTAFDAHGTNCAGIAAGDDPGAISGLDYAGGVAPDATLYSLKILPSMTNAKIALAWDWAVVHRNDDPVNPILVISTSVGGGRYFTECSWNPENFCLVSAAQIAVSAGITIVAAAGNDGYCDSIGSPACLGNVISVGAVYDAAWLGTNEFGYCVSDYSCIGTGPGDPDCPWRDDLPYHTNAAWHVPQPDLVPLYSNASPLVNVLAPSNACVTTDLIGASGRNTNTFLRSGDYTEGVPEAPFGGTSAACPYVAGTAAVLQSATLAVKGFRLTPGQVRDYLQWSGNDVWDGKGQVWTARINLDRAVEMAIGTWVDFGYVGPEQGIITQPFNTLAEAVASTPDGGLINLQVGATNETITINKAVTLQSYWGGAVTIGQ